MLSFQKLVFFSAFLFSVFLLGAGAPLRARPRRSTGDSPPAPAHLTLQAQRDSFDFDLASSLFVPPHTLAPLDAIPTTCATYNAPTQDNECSAHFVAWNITYGDCGDAWTVCRCSTANMTMDTVVDRLGRVPVGLRRYVGTIVVAPGTQTHAYTLTTGDVHMFGDPAVDTWVHEASHAYDWASGSPHSGTNEWQQAIQSDTCVPDTYSTTSAGEDFAQVSVLMVYAAAHNNTLPEGWTPDCMSHQLEYMDTLPLFNPTTLFGNTCTISGSDPGARHTMPPHDLRSTVSKSDSPLEALATGDLTLPRKNGTSAMSAMLWHWRFDVLIVWGGLIGRFFW